MAKTDLKFKPFYLEVVFQCPRIFETASYVKIIFKSTSFFFKLKISIKTHTQCLYLSWALCHIQFGYSYNNSYCYLHHIYC